MSKVDPVKMASSQMRKDILRLTFATGRGGAHVAPSLSCVDLLSTLFMTIISLEEDYFVLSKGHAGLAYYSALCQVGDINAEELDTFDQPGGYFPGQPIKNENNSIIYSSGSLGMGLPYAVGRAFAMKKLSKRGNVYVLLGDGELNEGSIWEAAALASQYKLDNLVVIIDNNSMQSDGFTEDILSIDLLSTWRAFGWEVASCDGHDPESIHAGFESLKSKNDVPKALIAKTVKGKGVSFMENNPAWHHSTLTEEEYKNALSEVE